MFCTACDIEVTDSTHYKTELHSLNSKRKLLGFPPLSQEELNSKIEQAEEIKPKETIKTKNKIKQASSYKKCAFCDEKESSIHYKEHGLSDEQIYCFEKKQCYVCYEKFCKISDLIKHLEADQHRRIVTDGVALYLENGKILNPSNTQMPVKVVAKNQELTKARPEAEKVVEKIAEKTQEDRRVQQLKISVEMNGRWGKWIH